MSKAKMMYAFDHIPVGASAAGGNVSGYAADYPFVWTAGSQGQGGGTVSDSGGVWLGVTGTTGAAGNFWTGAWLYPFSQYDLTKARSWFSARIKLTTAGRVVPILSVVNSAYTYQFALVGPSDYAWVTNQEHYVEVMIDRVNKTRSLWVDGQAVITASPYGSYAISNTDLIMMGSTAAGGSTYPPTMQFKDIYIADDAADGTFSRLGPQLAKPITLASAAGAGWTASSGTIVAALNTAINTSTPSTPNVTSPSDGTALAAALTTSADAGAQVNGVLLLAAGSRNAGSTTVHRTTISDQATPTPNQQTLTPVSFPTGSFAYGKVLGFLPNALDGTSWTTEKVKQLTLSSVASAT